MDFEFWNRKHEIAFRAWTWRKKWTMGREKSMIENARNGQKRPQAKIKAVFGPKLGSID